MKIDINGISSLVSQQIGWHYNKFFDLDFPYLRTNIKFVKMENDLDMSLKMGLLDSYSKFDYSDSQSTESEDLGIALASDPFEHPDFSPEKGLTSTEFGFEVEYTGSVMPDKVLLKMRAPDPKNNFDEELTTDGDLIQLEEEGKLIYYLEDEIQLEEVGKWKYFIEAFDENGVLIEETDETWGPEIIGSLESFDIMFSYFSYIGLAVMGAMGLASFFQKKGPYGPIVDLAFTLSALVGGSIGILYPYGQIKDKDNEQLISEVECGALKLAALIYSIEMLIANILAVYFLCKREESTEISLLKTFLENIISAIVLFFIPQLDLGIIIDTFVTFLILWVTAVTSWKACLDNQGYGVVGLFAYAIVHIASIIIYSSEFLGVVVP